MSNHFETHHINLDRSDNTPDNLITIPVGIHHNLHDQLTYLMDKWELNLSRKNPLFKIFVRYFIKTGELQFDRTRLKYYITPKEDGILRRYELKLQSVGINVPYCTPDNETLKWQIITKLKARKTLLSELTGVFQSDIS
jgi:hypothetical protein